MDEWPIIPLGDLVEPERSICYGIVQPGSHVPDGIPIIRVNNFSGGALDTKDVHLVSPDVEKKYTRSRLVGGELLVTLVGSIGQTAFATDAHQGWNVARAVGVVPLRPNVDSRWVNFAIRGHAAQDFMIARANTTVQTTFNLKDLTRLPIPFPPDSDRIPMTAILSALDDKIDLNRRMNATLEAMARALFRDWFVTFGPTRAKMALSAKGAKNTQTSAELCLAPDIWSLFPDQLDEEGMPEGWEMGTLADIAESPRRGIKPAEVAEDTPYIGLEHLPRRSIALCEWEGAGKVTSNKSRFQKGEFLFGKLRPYFHKVGVAAIDGICSTDIVVMRPKSEEWAALTLACISSDVFVEYAVSGSTGTKMPRTSWKIMGAFELSIPSQEVAKTYQALVGPMIEKIIDNIHQSRTLAQTRDLLLPRLMSGEIRLREAEQIAEEVL